MLFETSQSFPQLRYFFVYEVSFYQKEPSVSEEVPIRVFGVGGGSRDLARGFGVAPATPSGPRDVRPRRRSPVVGVFGVK